MATWKMRDGKKEPMAMGICLDCHQVLESMRPGHFVACKCGHAVDTCRGAPHMHRFLGNVRSLTPEEREKYETGGKAAT